MKAYPGAILTIIALISVIDYSLWKRILTPKLRSSRCVQIIFFSIPTVFIISQICFYLNIQKSDTNETKYFLYTISNGLQIGIYLSKILILILHKLFNIKKVRKATKPVSKRITRAQFLGRATTIIGTIPFASIAYNMNKGRFKHRIYKSDIPFDNLPEGLNNLRIVQLSDLHLGNYNKHFHILEDVVNSVNNLKPDLILLTGDIVNNFASEAQGWDIVFSKMKAKYGKYAILGNHDYGDYSEWISTKAKEKNLIGIKKAIDSFGFNLLLNENTTININNSSLSLIGVENWGHPPFPRYGDLNKATSGALKEFKILLTHDPDHWEAEVVHATDINLSMAGHTHGMQVGLRYKDKQWSPAKWKYKYWGGLSKIGNQYLYVNRGLGVIGMPIRIGMPAEISQLILRKK